ncbi:MAG: 4'-phosphopantetheinyl transferase superfamily protein [Holosporaceae bacterium]|jgi:phosphopantetheinyl transferase|nr:4'-phosphopantetheinyl transferase superfamily protein [Holosporaceae bacterium]
MKIESLCSPLKMPFCYGAKESACGLAVMKTSDFSAFSYEKWLSKPELEKFDSLGSEKTKIQFACGRIASKIALGIFEDAAPSDIDIANEESGRPVIHSSDYGVSISHSEKWIAALVFQKEFVFGIDVEQMRENRRNALKYVNRNPEPIPDDLKSLTVAWTMKEALSKALQLGFNLPFEDLAIADFSVKNDVFECEFTKYGALRGWAILYENISLAMAYEKRCLWNCDIHQMLFPTRPAA